jgi:DNA-binding HxlR family transcriptional regulator
MQVVGIWKSDMRTPIKTKGSQAKRLKRSDCPLSCALDRIGDKWSLLIVRDLLFGRSRFGELLNAGEGIPTNILSQRLKHLEQAGIIERRPSATPRSRYDYRLTETGLKLATAVRALAEWGRSEIAGTRPLPRQARRRKPKNGT